MQGGPGEPQSYVGVFMVALERSWGDMRGWRGGSWEAARVCRGILGGHRGT